MQVTHFIGTMRPGHDGVSRVAFRMREGFRKDIGNHVFVSPIVPKNPDADIVQVTSLPFPLSTDYRLSTCTTEFICNFLKENSTHLIHVHTPCTLGRAAIRAAQRMKLPIIATYHTHFPTYLKYYKLGFLENWVWKYLKRLYGACTVVAVPSQAVLKELQHQGIDNLIHIPHGVDTQRFSPSHRKIEWRDSIDAKNKMVVTFVGRLVWEKNLKLLADALILLKNRNQVKVVIVGEGPARNKLQEIMPDAYFTGYLGDVPLPIAYASSDIFVFPSATETFGNVTVEAMASGLPAICASVGGACDLIQNGVNGLLVSGSNPQEFANAIDLLVEQPELRKKLSHAALESISNYRWEKSIERYESIYQEILKN